MTEYELQKNMGRRDQFKSALKKRRYPSIVSVLSLSDETSRMMKEENRHKRLEAERKRAERLKR